MSTTNTEEIKRKPTREEIEKRLMEDKIRMGILPPPETDPENPLDGRTSVLLTNGDATPAFLTVLKEIFTRFDVDGDGEWNDKEMDGFTKVASQRKFTAIERKQIRDNFACSKIVKAGGKKKGGGLLPQGLMALLVLQTRSEPSETWKDLRALGYDKNLVLSPDRAGPKPKEKKDADKK